jgi:hypothetical protein
MRSVGKAGISLLALGLLVYQACNREARSMETVTECAPISPRDGRSPLAFVATLHAGDVPWGYPDPDVERRGPGWRYDMNDFESAGFTSARLECVYAINRRPPLHSILLPIPGLLLRCESEGPDPAPDETRMHGRYWCTSRIDDPRR